MDHVTCSTRGCCLAFPWLVAGNDYRRLGPFVIVIVDVIVIALVIVDVLVLVLVNATCFVAIAGTRSLVFRF